MTRNTAEGHQGILRQLFRLNLAVTVFIGVSVGVLVWIGASVFLYNQNVSELRSRILMISELGFSDIGDKRLNSKEAADVVAKLGKRGQHHVAMALKDGTLLGDVEANEKSGAFNSRHEVVVALRDGEGVSRRYSTEYGKTMLYLARQLPETGASGAVIRVAIPVANLDGLSRSDVLVLALFVAAVIGTSLFISYSSAARVITPVSELERGLQALGAGEHIKRLSLPEMPHMNILANALNSAADRLDEKISSLENEKALSAMILANIPSGIITLDDAIAVTAYNIAAARLMGFEEPHQKPISASAKIDNLELMRIVYETIKTGKPTSGEIKLGATGKTIVEVLSNPMRDANEKRTGILLLLSNVTRVRKLETVRQDFVGNVAHELRTPITSIGGFAELLTHTAPEDAEKISKYSAIILRQSNQMMMIIDDLLTLASLDDHDKSFEDSKQASSVTDLIANAVELCNERIKEKNADVVVACDEAISATIHAGLMEQAVVNLIDNAVKYGITDASKRIEVTATRNEGVVDIKVTDHGNGIPEEHLERIFERFYRVDKGRGREQGGTGLGLAIVKHIVQLHGGTVSVESRRGERTCFTLRFPADKSPDTTGTGRDEQGFAATDGG